MGKDLGTYHLKVEFIGGEGYIERITTGLRYTHGTSSVHPLHAEPILPHWEAEEDLIKTMLLVYTEGNFSCDCNRLLFIKQATTGARYENVATDCGDSLTLKKLTLIRPDSTELIIYNFPSCEGVNELLP